MAAACPLLLLPQRWIASANLTYKTRAFAVPPALLGRRNVELVLQGQRAHAFQTMPPRRVAPHRTYVRANRQ